MNITVYGLWHLGTVTASCLASLNCHKIFALDDDTNNIKKLNLLDMPIDEPGLRDLTRECLQKKNLVFTEDKSCIEQSKIIWVTFDTPVDDYDNADTEYVIKKIKSIFPFLENDQIVMISSQLPVGSTKIIECEFKKQYPNKNIHFVISPENLRLGSAINDFLHPKRVVVGYKKESVKIMLNEVFSKITDNLEWMGIESAEMTKHAINAFLATSVSFINEIAIICEQTGANISEVSRSLKSDERIGPKAYLKAGSSYSGGTLARDVSCLMDQAVNIGIHNSIFSCIQKSNEAHKMWPLNTLNSYYKDLSNKTISVLGLTYKPNTNTLRRSSAVEICKKIASKATTVCVYDPAVESLPFDFPKNIVLCKSISEAICSSDALLILTEWSNFKVITAESIMSEMKTPMVIDPNGFLENSLKVPDIVYIKVGYFQKNKKFSEKKAA